MQNHCCNETCHNGSLAAEIMRYQRIQHEEQSSNDTASKCKVAAKIGLMHLFHLPSLVLFCLTISSCFLCSLGRLLAILNQIVILLACASVFKLIPGQAYSSTNTGKSWGSTNNGGRHLGSSHVASRVPLTNQWCSRADLAQIVCNKQHCSAPKLHNVRFLCATIV